MLAPRSTWTTWWGWCSMRPARWWSGDVYRRRVPTGDGRACARGTLADVRRAFGMFAHSSAVAVRWRRPGMSARIPRTLCRLLLLPSYAPLYALTCTLSRNYGAVPVTGTETIEGH